ncbi:MAG: PIN domain-containing protein [Spirochaetaceae bacterium]|nr:PIN domain-containing protein [Spirochaetaceae bacterium]
MSDMVVLIDTNIIIDFLTSREPFTEYARAVMNLCSENKIQGFFAAHTLPDIYFILRKDYATKERRKMLLYVCEILSVAGFSKNQLISALDNENFDDFEDCLQSECALAVGAQYIVTRNTGDFSASPVPAVLPEALLTICTEAP